MMHDIENQTDTHESLQEYLPEFLKKYNTKSVKDIDCKDVNSSDFERLGDAVMESNHPGEAHEAMDQMMGGEGSERLEQMHINMGKSFLGCYSNDDKEVGGMGNTMYGIHTPWASAPMTIKSHGYLWGINSILASVLLVVLIRYFWKKAK